MCGPANGRESNPSGPCSKAEPPSGSSPLPPTSHATFAKSAKLSELDSQMGIHSFHKYLLSTHEMPGPGISCHPFPVVLRRGKTDSNASRAQAGDRNEEVGGNWGMHAWSKGGSRHSTPAGCCRVRMWPSMARAFITSRDSENLYFYVKSYNF